MGREASRRPRGRQLVADRDGWPIAANPRGLDTLPIKAGSPSVPMPGYDIRVIASDGTELPPGSEGALCSGCRCHRARWRPCGATTSGTCRRTCPRFPATTSPGTVATSMRTATSSSWDVPTTSSTLQGIGCPPAMEAVLAAHPAVAECAVIGVADELKGTCRGAWSCSRQGQGRSLQLLPPNSSPPFARRSVRCGAAPRRRGGSPAEDSKRQDPAAHDARDRRWRRPTGAVHDRGSDGPRAAHAGTTRLTPPCRSLLTEVRGHARNEGIGNALPPVLAAHHGRVVAIQHVAALPR